MALRLILNEELPPDLREALNKQAEEEDITVNDAANRVLAKHYRTGWSPSGFRYRPVAARFKLRVPDDLHREIRVEAADKLLTIRGITLNVLSNKLGTTVVDPHRRSRKKVVAV